MFHVKPRPLPSRLPVDK